MATGGEAAWCTLPRELRRQKSVAVNGYETTRTKLKITQLRKVYFCYYCAIDSSHLLSNGGVLVGNKLMSRSTGSAHCYVRPPSSPFMMVTYLQQGSNGVL